MTRRFALTFDYLCPFARNANEHVVTALRTGADLDVTFTPFSLAQGHVEQGATPVWSQDEPLAVSGIRALATGIVVRDQAPEAFLDVHEGLFAARHDDGADIKDPEVVAGVLRRAGLDADAIGEQVAHPDTLKQLQVEHETAAAREVWGVPTFMTDERAVFVRVLDRPEGDGDRARRRIELIVDLVGDETMLHEFKQVDLPM
ncbi:MAG: DsbA family protein [Nitriliruptoraceae bacterium]|nr:DsbA family protein [Nitriliruptoraceae bacterium]